jgi:hypothetical protein
MYKMENDDSDELKAAQRGFVSNAEATPFSSLMQSPRALSRSRPPRLDATLNFRLVSVLTYNILSDTYADPKNFPKASEKVLKWPFRREKILEILLELDADIMALQELELVCSQVYFDSFGLVQLMPPCESGVIELEDFDTFAKLMLLVVDSLRRLFQTFAWSL